MTDEETADTGRCERRSDFQMDNRTRLPDAVFATVLELICRDDVNSVSCPYDDPDLWRELIAEQVRRAARANLPPMEAFPLFGPDSGLWDTPVEEWGGYCHIPYEGMCGADLVFLPLWRTFNKENAKRTGHLSTAIGKPCYYLLSATDFGEVNFAVRLLIGRWVLYQANEPYVPCRN